MDIRIRFTRFVLGLVIGTLTPALRGSADDGFTLDTFRRQKLTGTYYSEGVHYGDLNRDGHQDVIYGPYWFAGPEFQNRYEIYEPVPQPTEGYANHFFCWTHDFNKDTWPDILVVGFPGTPAYVYENPGPDGHDRKWPRHQVFDWVSNESPQWKNLVGDERPELVCTRDGFFGYVTPDWDKPFEPWTFQRISEQVAAKRFGHALGVGDIDGDNRQDVLVQNGWYEQPDSLGGRWPFHPFEFSRAGGADMFAYDVDGDGDNDVITSLDAHGFGLAWYEQRRTGEDLSFVKHLIMGQTAADNKYGVVFTELHSLALADIDGDGLKDICTGKTYYSHHKQAPMWDAGAVVYWFKLVRTADGVDWLPFQADDQAGIGRQLVVADVNGDSLPDILTGGMKGCHVLIHERRVVDRPTWLDAQPRARKAIRAGLRPDEAAQQMTLPPGFHAELAAGEPDVHQPIAMAIDHKGRLWIAEAYNYPLRAADGEGRDKIVILEDTDLDGTLDSRKEFITGLNLVSGLEVGFGGVWIGAAPYLLFVPDADGDDVPDGKPQVVLDGFGYQDTHETLNSFIWGPDGWLYGCHGVFTHSKVGKPGTPDEQRVPMNAAVWRYHPTRHVFDIFARGTSNPWGVDFNDEGQAIMTACVIPHLWHVIQGARYQRQGGQHFNPHVYDDIKTIADHSHYTGNIRDSAWWGHEPELSDSVSLAGGGHAHCGAMIYLGDNWPAKYRNSIYFNNIHGNRVNNDILERIGSGYVGHHGKDFLMANDKWYRGINLKYGPDGTVYLIDWYDKNACHRTNPEIWDRSNGRVYRIRYGDVQPRRVDLSRLSNQQLARLQTHNNDWYVRQARRLLQERSAAGQPMDRVHMQLNRQLAEEKETRKKLRALWALHVTDGITPSLLLRVIQSGDEYLRAWAIQLGVPAVPPGVSPEELPPKGLSTLVDLAKNDPSPVVRLYLASALQRLPHAQRWEIADALLQHDEDADDHNLPLMIWYGVEPIVPTDARRAMQLAQRARIEKVARFIVRRIAVESTLLNELVASVCRLPSDRQEIVLNEMLKAFEGRVNVKMPDAWQQVYAELLKSERSSLHDMADQIAILFGDKRLLPRMRATLADANAPLDARRQALDVLLRAQDKEACSALLTALDEPRLQPQIVRALASYNDARIPVELLKRYRSFDDEVRRDAISTLTSRPSFAMALLDAIQNGTVPSKDVHAYHIRQLRRFDDPRIVERIQSVWGAVRDTPQDKREAIERYKAKLSADRLASADLSNGRAVFNKTCASCHRLFGEGGAVGPDLTGSNRANLDYILENIVDPSSVVGKDYTMSTLSLVDGRVVTGLIEKETDSAYTVRTVNDVVVIPKNDIEEQTRSPLSLMPEGQLDQLSDDDARDLIAYLASPTQVPLPRIPLPIDSATGKVPDAIEGETMKVVGKSDGNVSSQDMRGFHAARWSNHAQLWWTGQREGSQLDLEFEVPASGSYRLETVFTRARDYGIIQLGIDGEPLGQPLDCFVADRVDNTGVLTYGPIELKRGKHRLSATIVGKNPQATNYMFGLDYIRLIRVEP